MARWVFLIITLALLTACGGPSETEIQGTVQAAVQTAIQATASAGTATAAADLCGSTALNTYADTMDEEIKTFEAQTAVTGSTPRASLGTPLQKLVDIQTETRRMKAPDCLKAYHEEVLSMMGLYRLSYETFAAQGDETTVQAAQLAGQEMLARVKTGLVTIRSGKVPPVATPAITPTP